MRVLGSAALVCAALVAPAIARADTRTADVTLANPLVTPVPVFQTGFGVYNFTVANVKKGGVADASFPFSAGAKFGHCVELNQDAGNSSVILRTAARLQRQRGREPRQDPVAARVLAAQQPGQRASRPRRTRARSGRSRTPAPRRLLTNPAAAAIAKGLVRRRRHTHAADATKGASIDIVGGADTPTCAGTSRTVIVTGTPFTNATLTITSGSAVFATTGMTTATVAIGADGTGTAVINSDVNNPGAVTISASITVSTMVQSDGGGKQDFAYLQDQTMTRDRHRHLHRLPPRPSPRRPSRSSTAPTPGRCRRSSRARPR